MLISNLIPIRLLTKDKYLKGTTFSEMKVTNEEEWLHQRLAYSHDIHHVVAGFSVNPAGEMGVMSISATQIGYPPFIFTTLVALARSYRLKPSAYEAYNRSINIGGRIGMNSVCLAGRDWSNDFDKDIHSLRDELGVVPCSPDEPGGMNWSNYLAEL